MIGKNLKCYHITEEEIRRGSASEELPRTQHFHCPCFPSLTDTQARKWPLIQAVPMADTSHYFS